MLADDFFTINIISKDTGAMAGNKRTQLRISSGNEFLPLCLRDDFPLCGPLCLLWQYLNSDRRWINPADNPVRVVIFKRCETTRRTNVSARIALARAFPGITRRLPRDKARRRCRAKSPLALPPAGNFRKSPQFRNILACRAAPYRTTITRLVILKPADF